MDGIFVIKKSTPISRDFAAKWVTLTTSSHHANNRDRQITKFLPKAESSQLDPNTLDMLTQVQAALQNTEEPLDLTKMKVWNLNSNFGGKWRVIGTEKFEEKGKWREKIFRRFIYIILISQFFANNSYHSDEKISKKFRKDFS